jgi:hypothetical protein
MTELSERVTSFLTFKQIPSGLPLRFELLRINGLASPNASPSRLWGQNISDDTTLHLWFNLGKEVVLIHLPANSAVGAWSWSCGPGEGLAARGDTFSQLTASFPDTEAEYCLHIHRM